MTCAPAAGLSFPDTLHFLSASTGRSLCVPKQPLATMADKKGACCCQNYSHTRLLATLLSQGSKLHLAVLPQRFIQPYSVLQTALSHGQIVQAVPACSQFLLKTVVGRRQPPSSPHPQLPSSPGESGLAGKHQPGTAAAASANPIAGEKSGRVC